MKSFLVSILAVLLLSEVVAADSTFRCRGRIVSVGDSQSEVLNKCGAPDEVEQWEESHDDLIFQPYDYEHERYVAPKLIIGPIHMEIWTYNMGSNKFIRYLHFQEDRLIRIKTGEKGSD